MKLIPIYVIQSFHCSEGLYDMKNIPHRKAVFIVILLVLLAVSLAMSILGFNSDGTVSIRLKWIHQSQFAGYYMAQENNYYSEAGLDVVIDPAGPNISSVQLVASGANDFGVTSADQIIEARSNGVPVVGVAVFFRNTPESLVSLRSTGINSPSDLEGKTVGVIYGNDENSYRLFLEKADVDDESIREVAAVPGIAQILSGEVDAKMAYEMNDAVLLELQGYEVDIIRFRDYDVQLYADTLFTTEEMINNHPDIVQAVVDATIKGWVDALDNPEHATEVVLSYNETLDYDHQLGYLRGVEPLIGEKTTIGLSDDSVWRNMRDTLYASGVISTTEDTTRMYTNKFILP